MDFSGSWRKWAGRVSMGSTEGFEKVCCEEKVVGRSGGQGSGFFLKMRKICTYLNEDDKELIREGGVWSKS